MPRPRIGALLSTLATSVLAGCLGAEPHLEGLGGATQAATTPTPIPVFEQLPPPPPLSTALVPPVTGLDAYVADRRAAILLGKAFFWDQQAGSDGMACASCHFQAGADSRYINQISPSMNHTSPSKVGLFNATRTGAGGVNYTLRKSDFPFYALKDVANRDSQILFNSDDVVSSAGVFARQFTSIDATGASNDVCAQVYDPRFLSSGKATRRPAARNAPTVINAVFNERQFWDGRANNTFNGVNLWGARDASARVARWTGSALVNEVMRLPNSSLASQAVGPIVSEFEMACGDRAFVDVARKLLPRRALALQAVSATDSVLGAARHTSGKGLVDTYTALIQRAFRPEWWSAPTSPGGQPQMERNFTLFWGLAIQLYESSLVSDDTPYDRYARGNTAALTAAQLRGLTVFTGQGGCVACHQGPALTSASRVAASNHAAQSSVQRAVLSGGQVALHDEGYYNLGVRPTEEDLGLGVNDPFGNPLAFAPQWQRQIMAGVQPVDTFTILPDLFEIRAALPLFPTLAQLQVAYGGDRFALSGAFKMPGLRNVELTGPYFHNGGESNLADVVRFYNRGGNRRLVATGGDTSGWGNDNSNLGDVLPLALTATQQADLVSFLLALTDDRVRWEKAPFDHPALTVPHGHNTKVTNPLGTPYAGDIPLSLPAVGSAGRAALGLPPLVAFDAQLR